MSERFPETVMVSSSPDETCAAAAARTAARKSRRLGVILFVNELMSGYDLMRNRNDSLPASAAAETQSGICLFLGNALRGLQEVFSLGNGSAFFDLLFQVAGDLIEKSLEAAGAEHGFDVQRHRRPGAGLRMI
jgi:hypothetical protein